jgi:hypothetical protein
MPDHTDNTPNAEGSASERRMAYKDHEIAYRDDEEGFELRIDGRSFGHMAERLGPGQYYSHLLPFVEYSTPEELAQALADKKGEAWIDDETQTGPENGHDGPHEQPQ